MTDTRCPTPEKASYPSGAKARAAVAVIRRAGERRHVKPSRAYPCACGRWHLTAEEYR